MSPDIPALPPQAFDVATLRQRRLLLMESPALTGVERAEVLETGAHQWRFAIHFVPSRTAAKAPMPLGLTPGQVVLVPPADLDADPIQALDLRYREDEDSLEAAFPASPVPDRPQTWRLEIREAESVDPLFTGADITLAAAGAPVSLPPAHAEPAPPSAAINYLAKDYDSFRRLMRDRMSATLPAWTETHPADLGNMLIESLAYAADYLSCYQDAVATEAYLTTARLRVSAKRHARLLDYRAHDGCAARLWVQIQVERAGVVAAGRKLYADNTGLEGNGAYHLESHLLPPSDGRAVFETLEDAALDPANHRIPLYAWGVERFTLPSGSTVATLRDTGAVLDQGDVLVLAATGDDTSLRHAVRLTRSPRRFIDPLTAQAVIEIVWDQADALPFDLPVAAVAPDGTRRDDLAEAWGNIVAADAGFTLLKPDTAVVGDGFAGMALSQLNLMRAVPYHRERERRRPAGHFCQLDPHDARPALWVSGTADGLEPAEWVPRPDLLGSGRFARDLVAETEADGTTRLRFGDGRHGLPPAAGTTLSATYRVGRMDCQVAADVVRTWDPLPGNDIVKGVRNPLPARGGLAAQSRADIQREAPGGFRALRRCVLPADYVTLALENPRVRAAVAETRWTGSWNTIFIHVQPDDWDVDALLGELGGELGPLRVMGDDVAFAPPAYVPLRVGLEVTVRPPHSRALAGQAVEAAVTALFRPGRNGFGQAVHASPLIAAAMGVGGITDAALSRFERADGQGSGEFEAGRIDLGPLEIARLDPAGQSGGMGILTVTVVETAS